MNNQPVTVEQLMQAVSMLGGRPEYKQYALTDPVLLKQAYNFVRACQEELPKFVETEVTLQAALAARPPRLPDGPVVTFEQAAVQITNLAPRGAKKRFEQFLDEDLDYRAVTPLFRDRGVPEKVINRLAQEFARWNSVKRQQTNRANAQKKRKKFAGSEPPIVVKMPNSSLGRRLGGVKRRALPVGALKPVPAVPATATPLSS